MSYDLSRAIGHTIADKPTRWNRRDLLLYAAGIGAKATDLDLIYELDRNFTAFPTFPVVLNFKGNSLDVIDFNANYTSSPIPGLPPLDPGRVVHATMSTEILRPIPPDSGEGWKLTNRIVGVHENKSGIILENEITLIDPNGTPYTRMIFGSFNLGAKAMGQPFSKAIVRPPQAKPISKDRLPDYIVHEKISPEQAVIYRLSGDYNPLHIDPKVGQQAGFGGVILHGLATYGFVARAVVSKVGGGDPRSLKAIAGRFTSPIKPGDEIETLIWVVGSGPNGTVEVSFICRNFISKKVAIANGVAHVARRESCRL